MSDEIRVDGIFDAKLIRENKSAKGIFLTLEIAADDYFAAKLSDVRPGALLKIGYQEIVDVSVRPLEDSRGGGEPTVKTVPRPQANEAGISKPKKRFEDYPLSAQCAMRTDDEEFQKFLVVTVRGKFNWREWEGRTFAEVVRHLLGVKSRTELATNDEAANKWRKLSAEFEAWQTDQRHAESVRR